MSAELSLDLDLDLNLNRGLHGGTSSMTNIRVRSE